MVAVTRQAESKMDLMAITTAKTISPMDTKNHMSRATGEHPIRPRQSPSLARDIIAALGRAGFVIVPQRPESGKSKGGTGHSRPR
jgi:hypothetical protein